MGDRNASQEFLDTHQYSDHSISRYEKIFGKTYVSTGGEETTKVIIIFIIYVSCSCSFNAQKMYLAYANVNMVTFLNTLFGGKINR